MTRLVAVVFATQSLCFSDKSLSEQNSLRYFGTRTAYDVVRNRDIVDENIPGSEGLSAFDLHLSGDNQLFLVTLFSIDALKRSQ